MIAPYKAIIDEKHMFKYWSIKSYRFLIHPSYFVDVFSRCSWNFRFHASDRLMTKRKVILTEKLFYAENHEAFNWNQSPLDIILVLEVRRTFWTVNKSLWETNTWIILMWNIFFFRLNIKLLTPLTWPNLQDETVISLSKSPGQSIL